MDEGVSLNFLSYPLIFLLSESVCAHHTYILFMYQQLKSRWKETEWERIRLAELSVCVRAAVLSTVIYVLFTASEKLGRITKMSRSVAAAVTETKR